jgi:choline dehydrogenase-like flavoprotein
MEHPHRWAGRAHVAAPDDLPLHRLAPPPGEAPPTLLWAGWSPSEATQEAEAIGNGSILLWFDGPREEAAAVPTAEAEAVAPLLGAVAGRSSTEAVITMRVEQLPIDASQVRLSSDTDELGVPRLVLDWHVDDGVDRGMRRLVELLARELGAAGIGRVELDPQGTPLEAWPREIGNHPMGTARMSADPSRGVVDADLRCHDVEDLYVLGSATFPTGGHANPTLTVVALAHRLAAHLVARGASG